MARKLSQSDPALSIDFFNSGFYTHRSQLFAPLRPIGVNVVSLHDSVLDGANMEDSDLLEWSRRPGFSIFCPVALNAEEVVNQFYSFRNFNGDVVALFDSNQRIAQFNNSDIISVITKTVPNEGFEQNVGSMMYFSDGAAADMQKWMSTQPFSAINPSAWGIPAPTTTPSIFNRGCWLPRTNYQVNNAILDPNGNVEVVTQTFGAGISGNTEPQWPTTAASTINDASVQWENVGPLDVWLPNQNYPVPVVVLDTNGNLQLATAVNNNVSDWDSTTAYAVGQSVFFGGNYWTAVAPNTDMAPSEGYATPTWVLSQNPITTGATAPSWNTTVGGQTTDGQYIWVNLGPGQLTESFGTSYVYCWRTIYGHLSTASPISINTGAIFGPVAAAITSFSITGDVITFFGTNNFVPGNVFTVQGLSSPVGELLNGQSFSIIASGTSPTQFSAIYDYPNTALTQDSGSTLNLIAQVQGVGSTSPLCNATASITQSSSSANIVTIYANQAGALLTFVPGLWVTLTGMTSSLSSYLNNQQFQIINVDPNGLWFQIYYSVTGGIPNQALSGDSGTVTFNAVEIYRTSDGGGIYLFAGAVTNPSGSVVVTPYDSGSILAGAGSDNGVPGVDVWTNPGGVASTVSFATVSLTAPSGGGSPNFNIVQVCKAISTQPATPGGTIQAAFPNAVTGGNYIVVFTVAYDISVGSNIFDSMGNPYTLVSSVDSPNDHGVVVLGTWISSAPVAAGATTISFTNNAPSSNSFFGFGAMECTGLSGSYQTVTGVYQASGTTLNTGTITTSTPNSVVLTSIWSDLLTNSGNTVTNPSGYPYAAQGGNQVNQVIFVANDGSSYQQMAAAYQVFTSDTTQSPLWAVPANSKALGLTVALGMTLYSPSDGLMANTYPLAVPPNISITGIQVSIEGSFTGAGGAVSVQLLKNGAPIGAPKSITPTGSLQNFVLGGMNDLWGAMWAATDFNSAFGVIEQASIQTGGSSGEFSIQNVRVEVFGNTSTTGWVFNDFTPDADLDVLLIAPQSHLNDPPPGAPGSSISQIGTLTVYWNGRIWMVVGNYVYFDAGPDCTNGVPEEAWPPANRFQFAGPVLNLEPTADGVGLLVILADRVNAILGGPETISFYPTDALSNFGISSPNAIFRDGSTIGLFTTQGQYFEIIGSSKEELGEHIADYLMANFNPTSTFVTMHRDGEDVGVFISNGVDRILRYGTNIGAWSVPSFPVGGAGALRSIETSVGQYSLMLAPPIAGTIASTGLILPGLGQSTGSGSAWVNPNNITLGSPTTYAVATGSPTETLAASKFSLNIPSDAIIQGVEVLVTGISSSGVAPAINNTDLPTSVVFSYPGGTTYTAVVTPNGGSLPNLNVGDVAFLQVVTNSSFGTAYDTVTLIDTNGNTWLPIGSAQLPIPMVFGEYLIHTFYAEMTVQVTSTAPMTITGTLVGSVDNIFLGFMNVTGIGSTPIDIEQHLSTTSNPYSGTITVGGDSALFSFIAGWDTMAPIVVPTGWTNTQIQGARLTQTPIAWGGAWDSVGAGSYMDIWNAAAPVNLTFYATTFVAFPSSASATVLVLAPLQPVSGATTHSFTLAASNSTQTFGSPTDLWNMPWMLPGAFNSSFGFGISAAASSPDTFSISEVQVAVYYQAPGNYLRARDITTWADYGTPGGTDGTPYDDCFITIGSITLTQPGAEMFPLQHVVAYFDAVGNLGTEGNGGPSYPNLWIMPNEISTNAGIGFIQLPEVVQEPPVGQNEPSASLLALRWPVNMFNSSRASQFVHHLQVMIEFEPENAPNTLKQMSFKENQE